MKTQEKGKKKLTFSSEITTVSNHTAKEITVCSMQQTEMCPVTLRQWGCAQLGSSADSQCAQKLFRKGHHLFNILEMGKAPP